MKIIKFIPKDDCNINEKNYQIESITEPKYIPGVGEEITIIFKNLQEDFQSIAECYSMCVYNDIEYSIDCAEKISNNKYKIYLND